MNSRLALFRAPAWNRDTTFFTSLSHQQRYRKVCIEFSAINIIDDISVVRSGFGLVMVFTKISMLFKHVLFKRFPKTNLYYNCYLFGNPLCVQTAANVNQLVQTICFYQQVINVPYVVCYIDQGQLSDGNAIGHIFSIYCYTMISGKINTPYILVVQQPIPYSSNLYVKCCFSCTLKVALENLSEKVLENNQQDKRC